MPTVLISGANRGVGLEFVKIYLSKGWTVIAAVRDPSSFPKDVGGGDNVRVVKLDAGSLTDAKDVAAQLRKDNVSLDVVIANAAINTPESFAKFEDVDPELFDLHLQVNVRGVLVLFQAVKPLLSKGGKFITISSGAGTISNEMSTGGGTYGLTKAALNFLTRKLHFENKDILVAALHPGWIATDMGTRGAKQRGLEAPPDDITQTVPGMVKLIDEGDKEKLGGWTTAWDGKRLDF